MDDLTPEQLKALEKMVDSRIKAREQQRHKKLSTIGIKGKIGLSLMILPIIIQVTSVNNLIALPFIFLAIFLIYADAKDTIRKSNL